MSNQSLAYNLTNEKPETIEAKYYSIPQYGVRHDLNHDVGNECAGQIITVVRNSDVDKFHQHIANNWKMTEAHKVKQFTEESRNMVCPQKPQPLSREKVQFLIRMCLSEMVEFAQTVCDSPDEAINMVRAAVDTDVKRDHKKPIETIDIIGQQMDSLVDCMYYMHNTAVSSGMNLSAMFGIVHAANMAKRGADGKFHRREDGKVVKPDGWKEPDINAEVIRQMNEGSF